MPRGWTGRKPKCRLRFEEFPDIEAVQKHTAALRRLLKSVCHVAANFRKIAQEPSAGLMGLRGPHLPASRSATGKLGDTARAKIAT